MRLTIGKRLFLGFLLILLLEIGIVGLGVVNIHRLSLLNQQSLGLILPMERIYELLLSFQKLITPANDYLGHGNIVEKEVFKLQVEQVEKDIARLKEVFSEGALPEFIQTTEESFQYLKEMANKIFQIVNPIGNMEGAMLMEEMDAFLDKATVALEEYHGKYLDRQLGVLKEQGAQIVKESLFLFLSFSFLCLALSLILNYLLARRIHRPLVSLQTACKKLSEDPIHRVDIRTGDEIEDLAGAFNKMLENLQKTTVSVKVLEEEQKRFQDVAQSSGDWIWETDTQGRYTYISPVAEGILGYKSQEMIGQYFYEFFHPDDKEELKKAALEIFSKKEAFKNFFNRNIRKDGQILIIETTGVPIVDENRRLLGYRGADRDITARKKAEEALKEYTRKVEEINKELDDFTYIISHDLKEPLRSIDAFSKFLEDDYRDKIDEEGKGYIKRIRANSLRMQNLIEDLLEISRIERRRSPLEEVEASDLINEVKLRLAYAIKEKNTEIVIGDNLPKIFCDRVRLVEVFANLFSNAIKFNDKPNPRIEVGCTQKDDYYEFYVKDNGPGIEEQYFDKIFEIFQRLGKKEDHEGTGAGLTIVKKIIEMRKGKIWVDSKVGEYTTFYFTIPKRKQAILGKKKIGEILVEKQLITKEELKKALDEQEKIS